MQSNTYMASRTLSFWCEFSCWEATRSRSLSCLLNRQPLPVLISLGHYKCRGNSEYDECHYILELGICSVYLTKIEYCNDEIRILLNWVIKQCLISSFTLFKYCLMMTIWWKYVYVVVDWFLGFIGHVLLQLL